MNRFWRSIAAGSAVGAAIGAYFYVRSRRARARTLMGAVSEEAGGARSARAMMTRAAGRMVMKAGKSIIDAGKETRAAGRRLRLGRAD